MKKTCRECGEEKEATRDNFHYKNLKKGTLRTICIPCWAVYHRKHYNSSKQSYIDKAKKITEALVKENVRRLLEYLKDNPCVDCKEFDPIVLEFDHVRGEKNFNISTGLRQYSWATIEKEIKKCEVRCANCHRKRTAKQFNHQKYLQALVA